MNIDGFYLKVNVNKKNMIDLEKLKKKKGYNSFTIMKA